MSEESVPEGYYRAQCERCGGTGTQQPGTYCGKEYPAAQTCPLCDGRGRLGLVPVRSTWTPINSHICHCGRVY